MEHEAYNIVRGVVVNNVDPYGGNRIQVRLGNIYDGNTPDEKLIYCTPLLPKLIHVIPKPNEFVLVFLEKSGAGNGTRFYIGPVLSQPQRFYEELKKTSEPFTDNPDGKGNMTLEDPNKGDNVGSIPDLDDISIIGRDNCEIRLKEHELRVLCGYKGNGETGEKSSKDMVFNKISPACIQMYYKHRTDPSSISTDSTKEYNSSINLFADRINLLSRHGDISIGELDNDGFITEEKMAELLKNCHPLVYGDKLVQFLEMFRNAFLTHTHPFPMRIPIAEDKITNLSNVDLQTLLSKSVKTC